MINHPMIWLAFGSALANWFAVWRGIRKLEYVAKPLVMISLILWVLTLDRWHPALIWFVIALVFSLWGDVFLMLPRERFIAGLISFLLAHVFYIIGLNLSLFNPNLAQLAFVIFVALPAVSIYQRLASALTASNRAQLKTPVLIYTVVISLMLLSALFTLTKPEWSSAAAISVSFGAFSFFISDAILAWNKFIRPIPYGRVMNMFTYHLGQFLIIWGALMHYLG